MTKKKLGEFLNKKPGYIKKGSKELMRILEDKGISLVGITQDEIKEVLRELSKKSGKQAAKKIYSRILVYDIETSLVEAQLWGSGKQYVGHDSITTETQIITVAWKWLGEDTIHHLKWSKKKSDKKLVTAFLEEYNKANMVVGWNNNSFDNKIIHSRAMKYGLEVNTLVSSYDIMRQIKKVFRLPSYSMAYVSKYLGLQGKLSYDNGIRMWKDIQWGPKKDAKNAMKVMIAYNVQDTALTEEIFFKIRKYLGNVIHVGALNGVIEPSCPHCGSTDISHHHSKATAAGTIQRVMECNHDKVKFKISNTAYLKYIL